MKKFPERMEVCAFHGLLISFHPSNRLRSLLRRSRFFCVGPILPPHRGDQRMTVYNIFAFYANNSIHVKVEWFYCLSEMFISLVQCYVPSQSIEIWRSLQKSGPLRNTTGVNNEVNFSFCCTIIICWNVWGIYSAVAFKHRNKWVFAFLTEHRVQKPTVCKYSP